MSAIVGVTQIPENLFSMHKDPEGQSSVGKIPALGRLSEVNVWECINAPACRALRPNEAVGQRERAKQESAYLILPPNQDRFSVWPWLPWRSAYL